MAKGKKSVKEKKGRPVLPERQQPAIAQAPPSPGLSPAGSPAIPPAPPQQSLAPGARPALADAPGPVIRSLPSPKQPALSQPLQPPPLSPGERLPLAPAPPDEGPEKPGELPTGLPPPPPPAPERAEGDSDPQGATIRSLLGTARTIAVVGASDKPGRPSHRVSFYLMRAGFDVYPVNPAIKSLEDRPAYPDLHSVPVKIDIVDIFRRPEHVPPVVDEAIAVGAKAVWMQEGIVNEEAAAKARAAGLKVVMDRCVMKEHRRMLGKTDERTADSV